MTIERTLGALFRLDEDAWMRHSNPLSFWTRFTGLPLLVAATASRVWIGWWSLIPVVLALLWIYLNPRLFPKPASTDNWASKGVLGERVWLNRDRIPVPERHRRIPVALSGIAAAGLPFVIWGTVTLDPWPVMLGFVWIYLGKLWFMDRMVWLYEDMKHIPEYGKWLY